MAPPGETGGVERDHAEPRDKRGGLVEGLDLCEQRDGDVLKQVFDICRRGLVGEDDGGDPATVLGPEGAQGAVVARHGGLDQTGAG